MLIHINGAKCIGIDAVKVTVELNIERGIGIHRALPIILFCSNFVKFVNPLKGKVLCGFGWMKEEVVFWNWFPYVQPNGTIIK